MSRRNKRVNSAKEVPEIKDEEQNFSTRIVKRETHHAKSIIDGKLYDTEKSERLSYFKDDRVLFRTQKGSYFSCKREDGECQNTKFHVHYIDYYDIRPENIEDAKETIGKYDVDRYIELFGKPEEA